MLQNELLGEVRRSDEEPAVEELTGLAAGTALIRLGFRFRASAEASGNHRKRPKDPSYTARSWTQRTPTRRRRRSRRLKE